jgi:hypothetical protein
MVLDGLTSAWESVNVPDLYFAGTLCLNVSRMDSNDTAG